MNKVTLIMSYNGGQLFITFSFTTSYTDPNNNGVIWNLTGVDNQNGNYTALGTFDNAGNLTVTNLVHL